MNYLHLETERLLLRPLALTDAPEVERLAGDEQIAATTLNIPHPYPPGAAEAFIRHTHEALAEGKLYSFAITRKSDGALVGIMGIGGNQSVHQRAEVGYWIGLPYWGQGYATEALKAVIRFGFLELRLNSIFGRYLTGNPASGRVMAKAGMQYEGTLRQATCKNGQFLDLGHASILREEWVEG